MAIAKTLINADNATALEAALAAVNGKSTAHTYTSAHELLTLAKRAEHALDNLGLTKLERVGAVYTAQSGDSVATAYKHPRTATGVTLQRKAAGWVLVKVEPVTLWTAAGKRGALCLTPAQDVHAQRRARAWYTVAAPTPSLGVVTP